MNTFDTTPERLTSGLSDLVGTAAPDYHDDILRRVARTRQRPAWTFPERWIPMALIAHPGARSRPRAPQRTWRQTWRLLAVAAVTLAIMAGLAIAGALRGPSPDPYLNGLVTIPKLELQDTWGPDAIDGLSKPSFMDVGPDGQLYVVNAGANEVLVLSPAGTLVRRWGTTGTGEAQFDFLRDATDPFSAIGGVAVGADGSVAVTDTVNDRVQQFTSDGTFIRQWGTFGPDDGQFLEPIDVAVGPDGTLAVVDDRRDDIQTFRSDGTWLATIGGHGAKPGQLANTGGVDVDAAGTILNADYDNQRIQAWDAARTYLWSQATATDGGPVSQPLDVAAAADGTLYVTDGAGIHILGADRSPLTTWKPPDAEGPDTPFTVAVAPDGSVFVASLVNDTIYRLTLGSQQVEATPRPSDAAPSVPPGPSPSAAVATTTTFTSPAVFPIPFTLDLPTRWSAAGSSRGYVDTKLTRGPDSTPSWVTVYIPINAFADPCHAQGGPMSPAVGPTVDDLVQALIHAAGMRSGPVMDVTVDGYHGKEFRLDNNIDIRTCSGDPWLHQWTFDSAATGPVVEANGEGLAGAEQRIVVLDVNGTRVQIVGWTIGSRLDEVSETDQVMDSIDFQ